MIKKILFFMLLLFFTTPIYAKEIKVDYVQNITANRITNNRNYSGKLGFILDENRVIYCIEPFNWIGSEYSINNNNFSKFSDYTNDYIRLVATYADEFVQKRDVRYYMAAQFLIWNNITPGTFSFTTNEGVFGTTLQLDKEKTEIDNFAKSFLKKPEFESNDIKGNMYEVIELIDSNNVLSSFNIINDSKNEVWAKDNKLYIKILSDEIGHIRFEKSYGEGMAIYYHNDQKQDLADLKSKVTNSFSISVSANEPYYNDYRIEFIDKESNELINSNIDFKVNDDIHSCSNGIYIDKITEGNYDVNVISVPSIYNIPSTTTFKIENGDVNNYTHKIYLEKKKNNTKEDNSVITNDLEDINYCVLTDFKELPNTFNYVKVIKVIIIIVIIIEILRHVKKIFED